MHITRKEDLNWFIRLCIHLQAAEPGEIQRLERAAADEDASNPWPCNDHRHA